MNVCRHTQKLIAMAQYSKLFLVQSYFYDDDGIKCPHLSTNVNN